KYSTDVALRIRDEDTDEIRCLGRGKELIDKLYTRSSQVKIDRGGTSGCLNVDVTLLKKRRWLCGSCFPVN
nr:hypothetical protein [Tanacetum cinerariifolium]